MLVVKQGEGMMAAVEIPMEQGPAQALETYMGHLKAARVSEQILDDAVEVYARTHSDSDDECDDLMSQLDEPARKAHVRKAILDVIFSVIAATELPFEAAFRAIVDRLDVHEDEIVVRSLKQSFLQRMATDIDGEGKSPLSVADIQRRLVYVGWCIDHPRTGLHAL
ncbi:MAG: hypothetical protein ACREPQ_00805 [Rhodanobacter sp.]